jgi:hypothetical protein
MLRVLITILFLNCATFATAGHFGAGDLRSFGRGDFIGLGSEFGLGGGFGFGRGHGFGLGHGSYDTEDLQTRFEDRFDELMAHYDAGVADINDFFTSDEYEDIVDDTERLSFRYDLFISGVERNIDRIDTFIEFANDELTYFSDLLADYQADDDLSPERLERIETWIGKITDRIETKIDRLTETQTTLETNLPTYQEFQTGVDTFLTDILAAGDSTTDTESAAMSLASVAGLSIEDTSLTSLEITPMFCDDPLASASVNAVPEPSTQLLALLVIGGMSICRRQRRA